MLKTLLRVQLRGLVATSMRSSRSKNGVKRKQTGKGAMVLFACLMLYCAVVFGFLFYMSFSELTVFRAAGIGWLYFAMYAILAFALMFIGSIFMTKSQLFEAKDNERLLAMPIRPRDILMSRMVVLLLFNFAFLLVVAVPAAIAWGQAGGFSAMGAVSFVLLSLALILFSLAVSGLFAWLLTLITSRLRKSALFSVVLSVVFLGLYLLVCMRLQTYVATLAANGAQIAGKLGTVAPLYWLGLAMADGEVLPLLYALTVLIVPFALAFWVLARSFIHIITTKRGHAKIRYEKKAVKAASADGALLRREWKRFTSNANYMLNAGLGVVFQLALAVFLIIEKDEAAALIASIGIDGGTLAVIAVLAGMMMQSMTLVTAPSISLEGKSLWIVRSLPISSQQILRAKQRMSNQLTVLPCVAMAAALCLALEMTALQWVLVVAASVLYMLLACNFGLIEGLKHANLTWENPAQVVKQGMAVALTMFGGWGATLALGLIYFFLARKVMGAEAFLAIVCAIFLALFVLSERYLANRGVKRFEAL